MSTGSFERKDLKRSEKYVSGQVGQRHEPSGGALHQPFNNDVRSDSENASLQCARQFVSRGALFSWLCRSKDKLS